jgi:arginase family enzyme
MRPVTVIGAATSAGTHYAGQERAPDAMRAAGLIERLVRAGITVTDHGNVVRDTFRVDAGHPRARNLAATVRAAQTVADAVEFAARDGSVLLVLGGTARSPSASWPACSGSSPAPASPTSTVTLISALPRTAAESSMPWASPTCSD